MNKTKSIDLDRDSDDGVARIEAEIKLIRKELDNMPRDYDSYYDKLFEIGERLNTLREKAKALE